MPLEWRRRITAIWSLQQFRYLVTGGVNTLLSYAIGAITFYLLVDKIHYLLIMIVSTVICVTVSYVNHKIFVFRTEGNFIREYLRFYLVYAVPICFAFVAFPVFYVVLGVNPYVAQALIMAVTVVASYIGHKRISFRTREDSST